ncbi:MAG TPA: hypothetical protein VMB26_03555 [Candidatus Binataceae bacterium]|nr:hypothetical protein [Candidatus Binataceae bacterium]
MARLRPLDRSEMTPEMAALSDKIKFDHGYYAGLGIFAHSQEFVEPMWSAYVEMFDGGLLDSRLKEVVRIKIAQNNDCFM